MNPLPILNTMAWGALAALGFALLFNVPRRTLVWAALCGAVGVGTRMAVLQIWPGTHLAAATLLAAALVACMAELLWRRLDTVAAVFSVPGVIPMVPGSLMFRAIVQMLQSLDTRSPVDPVQLGETLRLAGSALLVVGALAVGIAAPNLILYRRRPEA